MEVDHKGWQVTGLVGIEDTTELSRQLQLTLEEKKKEYEAVNQTVMKLEKKLEKVRLKFAKESENRENIESALSERRQLVHSVLENLHLHADDLSYGSEVHQLLRETWREQCESERHANRSGERRSSIPSSSSSTLPVGKSPKVGGGGQEQAHQQQLRQHQLRQRQQHKKLDKQQQEQLQSGNGGMEDEGYIYSPDRSPEGMFRYPSSSPHRTQVTKMNSMPAVGSDPQSPETPTYDEHEGSFPPRANTLPVGWQSNGENTPPALPTLHSDSPQRKNSLVSVNWDGNHARTVPMTTPSTPIATPNTPKGHPPGKRRTRALSVPYSERIDPAGGHPPPTTPAGVTPKTPNKSVGLRSPFKRQMKGDKKTGMKSPEHAPPQGILSRRMLKRSVKSTEEVDEERARKESTMFSKVVVQTGESAKPRPNISHTLSSPRKSDEEDLGLDSSMEVLDEYELDSRTASGKMKGIHFGVSPRKPRTRMEQERKKSPRYNSDYTFSPEQASQRCHDLPPGLTASAPEFPPPPGMFAGQPVRREQTASATANVPVSRRESTTPGSSAANSLIGSLKAQNSFSNIRMMTLSMSPRPPRHNAFSNSSSTLPSASDSGPFSWILSDLTIPKVEEISPLEEYAQKSVKEMVQDFYKEKKVQENLEKYNKLISSHVDGLEKEKDIIAAEKDHLLSLIGGVLGGSVQDPALLASVQQQLESVYVLQSVQDDCRSIYGWDIQFLHAHEDFLACLNTFELQSNSGASLLTSRNIRDVLVSLANVFDTISLAWDISQHFCLTPQDNPASYFMNFLETFVDRDSGLINVLKLCSKAMLLPVKNQIMSNLEGFFVLPETEDWHVTVKTEFPLNIRVTHRQAVALENSWFGDLVLQWKVEFVVDPDLLTIVSVYTAVLDEHHKLKNSAVPLEDQEKVLKIISKLFSLSLTLADRKKMAARMKRIRAKVDRRRGTVV